MCGNNRGRIKSHSIKRRSARDSFNVHYQIDYSQINETEPLGRSSTNIHVARYRPVPTVVTWLVGIYTTIVIFWTFHTVRQEVPRVDHDNALSDLHMGGIHSFIQKIPRECREVRVAVLAPPATKYQGLVQWLRTNPFYPIVDFKEVKLIDDLCAILCRPETVESNLTFFVYATDPLERMVRHIQEIDLDIDHTLLDIDQDLDCILNGGHVPHGPVLPKKNRIDFSNCVNNYCYFKQNHRKQRRHYLLVWGMVAQLYEKFSENGNSSIGHLYIKYREGTTLDVHPLINRLYELVTMCAGNSGADLNVDTLHGIIRTPNVMTSPSNIEDAGQVLSSFGMPNDLQKHLQDFYAIHA